MIQRRRGSLVSGRFWGLIGPRRAGLTWQYWRVGSRLSTFSAFRVIGQQVGTPYRTTLKFFEAGTPDKSALTLTFDERAESRVREVRRTVGLASLQPGRYRLRVAVSSAGARVTETAWLVVVKN